MGSFTFCFFVLEYFLYFSFIVMGKKIIRCSQCEMEFETGFDYRMHWETHLDEYYKQIRDEESKT